MEIGGGKWRSVAKIDLSASEQMRGLIKKAILMYRTARRTGSLPDVQNSPCIGGVLLLLKKDLLIEIGRYIFGIIPSKGSPNLNIKIIVTKGV